MLFTRQVLRTKSWLEGEGEGDGGAGGCHVIRGVGTRAKTLKKRKERGERSRSGASSLTGCPRVRSKMVEPTRIEGKTEVTLSLRTPHARMHAHTLP